jgi:hypothetical protein
MELLDHVNDMSDSARSRSQLPPAAAFRSSRAGQHFGDRHLCQPISCPRSSSASAARRRRSPSRSSSSNALANLRHQEADIAIRHVAPDDPALIGLHLRDSDAGFYAARQWIERHGAPASRLKIWRGRNCWASTMPNATSRICAGSAYRCRPRRSGWYRRIRS